ncbi:hypothetical protein [Methylococcus sp. EFPC2]|uniref:hypothetical protein n=1 Tax=Methylococcus sp. EFPC2 TaxID=2812648 RepID=UPI001967C7DC|nr:hypothetical protein [Methylococcus sp. EFPC2]QSA96309.1 hypothetical protein JWZ97_13910 [Methylococcus sp. EFPC2]
MNQAHAAFIPSAASLLHFYTPDRQTFYRRQGWQTIEDSTVNGEDLSILASRPMHDAVGL